MPEPTPYRRLTPYLVATAAVLGMAGVRWLLTPLLGEALPFITFFPAVFLASWYGGLRPALFATFASALLVALWFIPPGGALAVTGVVGTTGMALFVLVGISTAFLGESLHRAYRRAEQQIAAEAALRTSDARFQAMAESSPLGIFITDPDGDCSYTNPAYQRISGLAQHQALGSGWSEAIHPADRQRVFHEWYDAARRRIPFRSEHRFAHSDGSIVSTRVNAAEISDGERLMGYVGLVEDISAQAAAETALKQSEERYRAFIEQTAEGVWRFELEQPVPVTLPEEEQIERMYAHAYLAECNDAVAHMYGFERASELIGTRLGDMMPSDDPQNLEYLRGFIRSGYRLTNAESHEYDREGQERYFLNNLIGIVVEGQLRRAWGSQRDVTHIRQAEAAIQASEARFRSVFESGMIGIAFWNGTRMTDANDALLRILGYTRQDLEDGLLRRGRLSPPGFGEVDGRATEETRVYGSCKPYEKEFFRKDGSRVPVLVGGARLGNDLSDAVFFVLDLTERRRAEERLRQAERIEAVGQLAGGMAHEANNQMSVVLGAASFILAREDVPDAVRQDVEYIRQAAERTASITRQLLAFSRRQVLQPQVVQLNTALTKLEPILRRTLTEQQTLRFQLASNVPPIRADPAQLDQVLLNLTINARDAMPDGGLLTVETRETVLTQEYAEARPGTVIVPGRYTLLIVSDTGHGMDQDTIGHLFEPFFTTKAHGRGSGLGLAMVYGIVKQSGGYIWAYSEPKLGTTFKLYFPALVDDVPEPEATAAEQSVEASGGTVLVAEDDALVRGMIRRSLTEAGFTVIEAANGREALAKAAGETRLDALLTDLAMPEIGGRELARRLREIRPALPVLFISGYTDDEVMRRGLLESGATFLEKPFSPELLARKLSQILEANHPGIPGAHS
ncbi:MAG TPA: PAS domain S-box protein [Gemmatimonadales bacterium]|nr:PAS domain S-box protein [Gemmatimonadales bacterium]